MKTPRSQRHPRQKPERGFSLLEVMFALFLVAVVIGMTTQVASNSVRNATALKESTFARWVALNQLELYKMQVASGNNAGGDDQGEDEMGDLSWRWVRAVKQSSTTELLEVKVSVYPVEGGDEDSPVASAKGYVQVQ